MLNSSFAQFLADRGVVALEQAKQRDREALEGYRQNIDCHLGDFDAYWSLRKEAERLRAEDRRGTESAQADDVRAAASATQARRRDRRAEGQGRRHPGRGPDRPGGPTDRAHRRSFVLPVGDARFPRATEGPDEDPAAPLGLEPQRTLPARCRRVLDRPARPPARSAGRSTRSIPSSNGRRRNSMPRRARTRADPARSDGPMNAGPRARTSSTQQIAGVDRRIKIRTETLARRFDRVLAVLEQLGYVEGWTLTDKGRRLTRLYGEGDLLVGEALAAGMFEGLRPGEAAALTSTVVYEARERTPLPGTLPTPALSDAYERLQRSVAADPPGRGRPRGAALPGARARVRGAAPGLGGGRHPGGPLGRDRDGARGFRPQLQAAARPPAPGRGGGGPGGCGGDP